MESRNSEIEIVEKWYDEKYDEWIRLDRHKVEFEITKRYLKEYIGEGKKKILDIGGGPGRYSIWLEKQGHEVSLLDLSRKHIEVAKENSLEEGVELADCIKGNALDLSGIDTDYDVVLLMGPLYHLTNEEDRRKAIEEALTHLKMGGILIVAFISGYASLMEKLCFAENGEMTEELKKHLLAYLKNGYNEEIEGGFTVAYFTGIDEAKSLMAGYPLKQLAFAGMENLLGIKEKEINRLEEEIFDQWLDLAYTLSQDIHLLGTSNHLLYVGQKEEN